MRYSHVSAYSTHPCMPIMSDIAIYLQSHSRTVATLLHSLIMPRLSAFRRTSLAIYRARVHGFVGEGIMQKLRIKIQRTRYPDEPLLISKLRAGHRIRPADTAKTAHRVVATWIFHQHPDKQDSLLGLVMRSNLPTKFITSLYNVLKKLLKDQHKCSSLPLDERILVIIDSATITTMDARL